MATEILTVVEFSDGEFAATYDKDGTRTPVPSPGLDAYFGLAQQQPGLSVAYVFVTSASVPTDKENFPALRVTLPAGLAFRLYAPLSQAGSAQLPDLFSILVRDYVPEVAGQHDEWGGFMGFFPPVDAQGRTGSFPVVRQTVYRAVPQTQKTRQIWANRVADDVSDAISAGGSLINTRIARWVVRPSVAIDPSHYLRDAGDSLWNVRGVTAEPDGATAVVEAERVA